MKFERIVKFGMPFDKRSDIPRKNYGISAMRIIFILKGRHGAVQVIMSTSLYTKNVALEHFNKNSDYISKQSTFDCWDVGFHSKKKPSYMNKSDQQRCNILGKCYYDGSSLRGRDDKVAEMFLEKGEEAIWKYLEKYYYEVFALNSKEGGK